MLPVSAFYNGKNRSGKSKWALHYILVGLGVGYPISPPKCVHCHE